MTMKKNRLSPRDQEMLSAYLDGQLSRGEVARLQARLKDDHQMQSALEELRMTRAVLRSLPLVRAPRNFTLTPEMVNRRIAPRRPAYPVFGFASLVASLLLVLVFVADRMSFINTAQTAALQSAAQATRMEEMVQTMVVESLAAQGSTAPEAMLEMEVPMAASGEQSSRAEDSALEQPVESLSMTYPGPSVELYAESEMAATEPVASKMIEETPTASSDMQEPADLSPQITATPTPTPTPFMVDGTEVMGVGGGAPDTPRQTYTPSPTPSQTPEPSPTPSPTCTLEPTSLPTDIPVPSDTPLPTDTAAPLAEALEMQLPASETPLPTTSLESQVRGGYQPSRILFLALEIVLGLLAAGSAIIFFYLYRKSS